MEAPTTVEQARRILERVRRGDLDLRPIGELLTGKFDQDFPRALLDIAVLYGARFQRAQEGAHRLAQVPADQIGKGVGPTRATDDDRLTDDELAEISKGSCPECHMRGFVIGPQGGGGINIECASLSCRHRFNVAFFSGRAMTGQWLGSGFFYDPWPSEPESF